MNNEQKVEALIQQEQALAPRVTPEDLDNNIASFEFVKHVTKSGKVLRWCVLNTVNGFSVTGDPSVSVSIENDRQSVGEEVAYNNARSKLWPLMGYLLTEKLYQEAEKRKLVDGLGEFDARHEEAKPDNYFTRLVEEQGQNKERLDKLSSFLDQQSKMTTPTIAYEPLRLLFLQQTLMSELDKVLVERIRLAEVEMEK